MLKAVILSEPPALPATRCVSSVRRFPPAAPATGAAPHSPSLSSCISHSIRPSESCAAQLVQTPERWSDSSAPEPPWPSSEAAPPSGRAQHLAQQQPHTVGCGAASSDAARRQSWSSQCAPAAPGAAVPYLIAAVRHRRPAWQRQRQGAQTAGLRVEPSPGARAHAWLPVQRPVPALLARWPAARQLPVPSSRRLAAPVLCPARPPPRRVRMRRRLVGPLAGWRLATPRQAFAATKISCPVPTLWLETTAGQRTQQSNSRRLLESLEQSIDIIDVFALGQHRRGEPLLFAPHRTPFIAPPTAPPHSQPYRKAGIGWQRRADRTSQAACPSCRRVSGRERCTRRTSYAAD